MRRSSYDDFNYNFEAGSRRKSERKKFCSRHAVKKVLDFYFDADYKITTWSEKYYDFSTPDKSKINNSTHNKYGRTQYEINRELLDIQEYTIPKAPLNESIILNQISQWRDHTIVKSLLDRKARIQPNYSIPNATDKENSTTSSKKRGKKKKKDGISSDKP